VVTHCDPVRRRADSPLDSSRAHAQKAKARQMDFGCRIGICHGGILTAGLRAVERVGTGRFGAAVDGTVGVANADPQLMQF